MAHHYSTSIHGVAADDQVSLEEYGTAWRRIYTIDLPGGVCLFFDGHAGKSEANLLGFLDQMHAIRNAVLQDRADRAEGVQS